jgi:hypothetical protein
MRVRRQTGIGESDAPAIEKFAAGRDSDKHHRVTVLGNADSRGLPCSSSRHFPPSRLRLTQSLRNNFPRLESFSFPPSEAFAYWLIHKKEDKDERRF